MQEIFPTCFTESNKSPIEQRGSVAHVSKKTIRRRAVPLATSPKQQAGRPKESE